MTNKKYLCIALIVLLTFGILSPMVNALYPTTDPWPMYHYDIAHTGVGSSATVPSNNATAWSASVSVNGPPDVVDGMVIFPYSYNLYALDEATGVLLWTSPSLGGTVDTPTILNGIAYVGTSADTIYEINIATGQITLGPISISPATPTTIAISGHTMYFGTTTNYIYAYDTNGTFLWYYGGAALAPIYSAPAIQGDLLYFGCDNGKLYCLNVSSPLGAVLKWKQTLVPTGQIRTDPCLAAGKVFVGSPSDSSLYVFNATTGQFLWKWTTTVQGAYTVTSPAYYASSPHNLVFIIGGYANTWAYALYADATPGTNYTENDPGAKYWSTSLPSGYYYSAPIADAGKIFVVSTQGTLCALSITGAGALSWVYNLGYGNTEPVVADGRVFCGSNSKMVCIGAYFPALTYYYPVSVSGNDFVVKLVIANATPSSRIGTNLYLSAKQINYTLQGIDGTNGWSNITVADHMLGGPYTVTVDGGLTSPAPIIADNGTYSSIYFTYSHSSHSVIIKGTTIVPEFPSYIVLPALIALTFFAAVFAKKKLPRK